MNNYKLNLRDLKQKLMSSKEIKNAGWLIGGRIAQMLLSFFVNIWTARYLGPKDYGIINYAAAYVTFFTALSSLGINSIIIKEFVDHPNEQGEAIGTTFLLRLISSILSEVMIFGIVSIVNKNEPVTISATLLYSVAILFQVTDTINYWFQSEYRSKVVSLATLSAYIVTTIYKLVLLILNKDVRWFAFAWAVDYMCISAIMFIAYRKYNGPKLSVSLTKAKELLKKSHSFIIVWVLVAIYEQTDKIMLKLMVDETQVGYYSTAYFINSAWIFVLIALMDSVSPTILRCEKEDTKLFERKNRQLYAVIIYISIFMALGFILFGKSLICTLYGEEYLGAVAPLKILCWYTAFFYLGSARNIWLIAKNYQKYLIPICGGAAIANVGLNFALIPIWGASGAAWASLITQMLAITIIPYSIKDIRPNVKLMLEALLLRGIK